MNLRRVFATSFVVLATSTVFLFSHSVRAQDLTEEELLESEDEALPVEELEVVDQPSTKEPEATTQAGYPEGVEIEKSVFTNQPTQKDCNCEYSYLMPYAQRRGNWGFTFGLGYSMYAPEDYKPDFVVGSDFDTQYGASETPLYELTFGTKWNFGLGSLSLDVGGGYYKNDGKDDSTLTLIPIRLGGTFALDTLWDSPYVVPYGTVGTYVVYYEETLASQKVGGNTAPGLYWAGGVQFQLNWMDEWSALHSYEDTGLENAFIFVEARSFIASEDIPDLGSDPQIGAGLKLEY